MWQHPEVSKIPEMYAQVIRLRDVSSWLYSKSIMLEDLNEGAIGVVCAMCELIVG